GIGVELLVVKSAGKVLVRQVTASPGRLRVVADPPRPAPFHLLLARSTRDPEKPIALHPAELLRESRRQVPGGQGSQAISLDPAFLLDEPQRLHVLRHRPLSQDFPGEPEVPAVLV